MLNPNNDRLDYGSILSSPPNYQLDFAIGTSYSVDLDSLVGASISLGLSQETDTILRNNPIFLLEALRSTGDKIALFCENGRITLPGNPTPLYILLEEMVFQVNTPKKEHITKYPSFHPKLWLIRYVNEDNDIIYRVIVLSRNLTFDRNWDISFSMDGKKTDNYIPDKNKNLTIFLNYLKEFSTESNKRDKINEIIEELDYVEFDLNDNTFLDFDFIPNGISDDVSIENYPLFKDNFDNLVIVSPFLSKDVIQDFNQRAKDNKSYQKSIKDSKTTGLYLFTRDESLSKLNAEDCDEFKVYTLKDEIIDGEFTISGESDIEMSFFNEDGVDESDVDVSFSGENSVDESDMEASFSNENSITESNDNESLSNETKQILYQHQDIHAKIYFIKRASQVDLYLGSLNASHNALKGNVEFMVRLKTNSRKFSFDKFLNDLFCGEEGGPDSPFQLVDMTEHVADETGSEEDLDLVLKDIVHLDFKSKISFDDEFYKITLNVENYSVFENKYANRDFRISIKPLLSEKIVDFSRDMSFEKLNKIQLSTFFVLNIENDDDSISRVIKIETEGMPENRDKDLVSSIVNDKTAFIRYVAFLLGDDSISSLLETATMAKGDESNVKNSIQIQLPGLYEKMLDAAANNKEKFREIDYLIQTLSDDNVIPDGFEELYDTFKEVLGNV